MKALRKALHGGLWPLVVVATTLGFFACFQLGIGEAGVALVPGVALLLLFGLEFVLPDRKGGGAWGDPQAWNDIGHGVLGQGAGNTLGQMTFVFGAALLAGEISARWGGNLWPADAPMWLQLPLVLLIGDGLDYGRHRLQHTVSWLWPMHALHHDVDRMNVLKSSRGHFLDMLFRSLAVYAPLVLVGVPLTPLLAYAAAISVFGPVAHANVSLPVPAFMHRVFMTPQVHRIHHARPVTLSCSNYCNIFPIWDLMFGTFTKPEECPSFEYGVEDSEQPEDFVGQVLAPMGIRRGAGTEAASGRAMG